ncbi:MAG: cohesin domain-containing protein [Bacteroidota bacterium]
MRFLLLVGLLSVWGANGKAQTDSLYLQLDTAFVIAGDVVDVFLTTNGFDSIVSLQFSINWDPNIAEFAGFGEEDLTSTAIGLNEVAQGALRFSWFSPDGLPRSLPNGARLLRLNLRAVGSAGQATPVSVTDMPLAMQAFKGTATPGGFIELTFGPKPGLFSIAAPLKACMAKGMSVTDTGVA